MHGVLSQEPATACSMGEDAAALHTRARVLMTSSLAARLQCSVSAMLHVWNSWLKGLCGCR